MGVFKVCGVKFLDHYFKLICLLSLVIHVIHSLTVGDTPTNIPSKPLSLTVMYTPHL